MKCARLRGMCVAGRPTLWMLAAGLALPGASLANPSEDDIARTMHRPALLVNAYSNFSNATVIDDLDDERKLHRAWEGISTSTRRTLDAAVAEGWSRVVLNRPGDDPKFWTDADGNECGTPTHFPNAFHHLEPWQQELYHDKLGPWLQSPFSRPGLSVEVYTALEGITVGSDDPNWLLEINIKAGDPCGRIEGTHEILELPAGISLADTTSDDDLRDIREFIQPWADSGIRVVWLDHTHNARFAHEVIDKLADINTALNPDDHTGPLLELLPGSGFDDRRTYVGGETYPRANVYDMSRHFPDRVVPDQGAGTVVDLEALMLVPAASAVEGPIMRELWGALLAAGETLPPEVMPQMWIKGDANFVVSETSPRADELTARGVLPVPGLPDGEPRLVLGRAHSIAAERLIDGAWVFEDGALVKIRNNGSRVYNAYLLTMEEAYTLGRVHGVAFWVTGGLALDWTVRIFAEDFMDGIATTGPRRPDRLPFDVLDYNADGTVDEADRDLFERRTIERPSDPRCVSYFWGDYNFDGAIDQNDYIEFMTAFSARTDPFGGGGGDSGGGRGGLTFVGTSSGLVAGTSPAGGDVQLESVDVKRNDAFRKKLGGARR